MTKRSADADEPGTKRRSTFALVDGICIPADCWYLIFRALRHEAYKLKLLNKTLCAMLTQRARIVVIRYPGWRENYNEIFAPYIKAKAADWLSARAPAWIQLPRLRRVSIDLNYEDPNIEIARHCIQTLCYRITTPTTLFIYGDSLIAIKDQFFDELFYQPRKLCDVFHTIVFHSLGMLSLFATSEACIDFTGVTIKVPCTGIIWDIADKRLCSQRRPVVAGIPMAIILTQMYNTSPRWLMYSIDIIRKGFGPGVRIFVGDSQTPYVDADEQK